MTAISGTALTLALLPAWLQGSTDRVVGKLESWLETAIEMAPNFVIAAVVLVSAVYLGRVIKKWVERAFHKISDNEALSSLVGTVAKLAIVIGAIFIALGLLDLEKTVTSLLAGVGVVGLALGFAFQDIAANFISGAMLAIRGPFAAGDIIEINDKVGTVEDVHLRHTVLRTFDGLNVVIPNKEMFQNTLTNYTQTRERRVDVEVGVAYSDDLELAQQVVRDAMSEIEGRDASREVEVLFTEFGGSSINCVVRLWLEKPDQLEFVRARSSMIIHIKKAIDAAGLTIPFPIRTLDFGANAVGGEALEQHWERSQPNQAG